MAFYRTSKSTGSSNISVTLNPGRAWALYEVRLHLSDVGSTNSFVCRVDDTGTTYDCVLYSKNMTTATDAFWQPTRPIPFSADQRLVLGWVNGDSVTWGLEIIYVGI